MFFCLCSFEDWITSIMHVMYLIYTCTFAYNTTSVMDALVVLICEKISITTYVKVVVVIWCLCLIAILKWYHCLPQFCFTLAAKLEMSRKFVVNKQKVRTSKSIIDWNYVRSWFFHVHIVNHDLWLLRRTRNVVNSLCSTFKAPC